MAQIQSWSAVLRQYSLGKSLTELARVLGITPVQLETALQKEFGEALLAEARLSNIQASLDDVKEDLASCVDDEDKVKLAAAKARADIIKWEAEHTVSRFQPRPLPRVSAQAAPGVSAKFEFISIGDKTARLRPPEPTVIDVTPTK